MDFNSIIARLRAGDNTALNELTLDERKLISSVLSELNTKGHSKTLEGLYGVDYEQTPVNIDEFIDSDIYLGKIGMDVFDIWRDELRKVFACNTVTNEWVLRGSVGAGKSSVGVIALLYCIYRVLCLKNPQKALGQMEGSPIVVGFFNIYQYLAHSTAYRYFNNWMKLSPFFVDLLSKKTKEGELRKEYLDLPKGITIALGSSAIHALSQNLLYGLLDEVDMYTQLAAGNPEKTKIEELFSQSKNRIVTRFTQQGGFNPGLLILISQVRDDQAFLSKHIEQTKNEPTTLISSFSIWQVKHRIYEGEETFKVAVGNKVTPSYVVKEGVTPPSNLQVIDVPVSLLPRFEYDADQAVRDLAGIPTYGYRLLLPRRDKLVECYDQSTPREHPFLSDTVVLSLDDDTTIVDSFVPEKCVQRVGVDRFKPLFYSEATRAIHIDLAVNRDAAGISMGCVGGERNVTVFDRDGKPFQVKNSAIFIDFMLRIKAKPGSEIDFSKLRSFVFYLIRLGFQIQYMSCDSFQSVDSQQTFKKTGMAVETLSVDRKVDPYYCLKSTIMETRLDAYEFDIFTSEVTLLQDKSDIKGARPPIDHPKGGSKDVADSVCGVVFRLSKEKQLFIAIPEHWESGIVAVLDKKQQEVITKTQLGASLTNVNPLEQLFKS